ncbi:hypothetical protein ACWEIJ_20665 [Lentzea sp. NPDC004789]
MTTPDWTSPEESVAAFLDDYDRLGSDGGGLDGVFAATFLALDPHRALALTPQQLGAALPARRKMFADAGVTALRRQSARQQRLDDRHVLVSAEWLAERAAGPLTVASTFLLRQEDDRHEIVVYLNHTDLAQLL